MFALQIVEADTASRYDEVAGLLRDYLLWMRRRHGAHAEIVDAYFDEREWRSELADLRGHYGAPHGAILLALVDGVPAGCAVMRGIGEGACEMKRLFVRPAFRGMHVARLLIRRLAEVACECGYSVMRLDTGRRQVEAQALYGGLGFKPIGPYRAVPARLNDALLFFEGRTREIAGCAPPPERESVAA